MSKQELNKKNNKHANMDRVWAEPGRLQTYTKNHRELRNARAREVFHREEHTNWLSNTKWPLKT